MPRLLDRRSFWKYSAAAGAALGIAGGGYWLAKPRVRLGLIGAGVRGRQLARAVRLIKPLYHVFGDIVAIADVDRTNATATKEQDWPGADLYDDYRDLLARDDVEAVMIATPDHWHAAPAIEALRAGKAVYCEKPLAATIDEGQRIVRAVRESGLTFQFGNIQRSDGKFRLACELVRNGRIGDLRRVHVSLVDVPLPPPPFQTTAVPAGLDWDRWCGPASLENYCPERHKHWHYFWETGGGEMANWGVHHLDIVHWAMDDLAAPVAVDVKADAAPAAGGYTVPTGFTADMEYSNGVHVHLDTKSRDRGILFEGDKGRLYVSRSRISGKPVEELATNPLPADAIRAHDRGLSYGSWDGVRWPSYRHIHDFLAGMRSHRTPTTSVESAHRSTTACHIANISLRLGRPVRWDPAVERFVAAPDADALLSRNRRDPYLLEPAESS